MTIVYRQTLTERWMILQERSSNGALSWRRNFPPPRLRRRSRVCPPASRFSTASGGRLAESGVDGSGPSAEWDGQRDIDPGFHGVRSSHRKAPCAGGCERLRLKKLATGLCHSSNSSMPGRGLVKQSSLRSHAGESAHRREPLHFLHGSLRGVKRTWPRSGDGRGSTCGWRCPLHGRR